MSINPQILLLTVIFLTSASEAFAADNVIYYRQLVYNHVSPYFPIRGAHPIDADTAKSTPHYVFRHDAQGRLMEIVRNHPEAWKSHELTHLKVARVVFTYINKQERRTFFDATGERTTGKRGCGEEVFELDDHGNYTSMSCFDLQGQADESTWRIARYTWEKKGELIIERRFDWAEKPVNLSPYFRFGITGIRLGANGMSQAHYNLNEQLEITENFQGIASYNDRYDAENNHLEWSYRNKAGELTPSPWGYAVAKKSYDKAGNVVKVEYINMAGKVSRTENFRYSRNGQLQQNHIPRQQSSEFMLMDRPDELKSKLM